MIGKKKKKKSERPIESDEPRWQNQQRTHRFAVLEQQCRVAGRSGGRRAAGAAAVARELLGDGRVPVLAEVLVVVGRGRHEHVDALGGHVGHEVGVRQVRVDVVQAQRVELEPRERRGDHVLGVLVVVVVAHRVLVRHLAAVKSVSISAVRSHYLQAPPKPRTPLMKKRSPVFWLYILLPRTMTTPSTAAAAAG